jgi:SPP1 family predicted phage head-tail adaptor
VVAWTDFLTVYASITPKVSKEVKADSEFRNVVTHEIEIRYRTGIDATLRVKYGSRYFNIESVANEFERNRSLLLYCVEGLADG